MLNDIQKAEAEAKQTLEKASDAAEKIVQGAREEAVRIVKEAEEEVRTVRTSSMNEGKETGAREAEKITLAAETEIKNQEHAADALVTKAAESVTKRITESL